MLATNVAETSITVPGIRAVIDSGLARISRYSARNRLQRLPIEPISRASADQRKGRCGRLGRGTVPAALYARRISQRAPAFTEPEVLRTNLAALLLRLAADGLGDAEDFPFIDAPDTRALNDGYRLLQELQALDDERRITRRGRAMARLPLDPRLARALLESKRFHAEGELLAIVSGLSVPDVRRAATRPPDGRGLRGSEVGILGAGQAVARLSRGARGTAARTAALVQGTASVAAAAVRMGRCLRARSSIARASSASSAQRRPASYTGVHRSLLAGFCTMVGARGEEGAYSGTRGVHFHIFPGSPLARRRPRWVMAANIVETSRVFARTRRRRSSPRGSSRRLRISSSANISSRTGTRRARRWSPASASAFSA